MKQQRAAGIADIGLIAILAALCVIIVAGLVVWQKANFDNRNMTKHCTEVECITQ